jgi:hypothetical protein
MIDRTHPILAIVSRREFERLARQVQYGEIAWPQCYDKGKPIQLGRNHDNTTNDRRMLQAPRLDAPADAPGDGDDGKAQGDGPQSLELRHGGGEETNEGN